MIYFIPSPIGNLEDISLRSLRILSTCKNVICEDTRFTKKLINLLNQRFSANINIKSYLSLHSHNDENFFSNIDLNFFKDDVAYLSDAGMPCISDPGNSLVKFAIKNNLDFDVLPGSNAALLAIVSSSFLQKEFIFLGFLPNKGKERDICVSNALNLPYPCVIYESPKRILNLIYEIDAIDDKRGLFLIREATKKFQSKFYGNSKTLLNILSKENIKGEFVLVIDKNLSFSNEKINKKDIMELEIAPKIKAKLLSKIDGKSVKEHYNELSRNL